MLTLIVLLISQSTPGHWWNSIPEPYLISTRGVSFHSGFGSRTQYQVWPIILDASFADIDFYWQNDFSLVLGFELAHVSISSGSINPEGRIIPLEAFPHSLEIGTFEIGGSSLYDPRESKMPNCCCVLGKPPALFVPRIDLTTGVTVVSKNWYDYLGATISYLIWRTKLEFRFSRFFSLRLEHKFLPPFNPDSSALRHSFAVLFSMDIGVDIVKQEP